MQSLRNCLGETTALCRFRAALVLVALGIVTLFAPRSAAAEQAWFSGSSIAPGSHVALNAKYTLTVTGDAGPNGVYTLNILDDTTGGQYSWDAHGVGPSAIHTFTVVNQADGSYWWTPGMRDAYDHTLIWYYEMYGAFTTP